jgi:enhancing lycopene biosynthesis protein 2
MEKRVGVLLSGCGVFDGSEIHEAVLTLLALDRHGAQIVCAAPDMPQLHVVNHMTTEETSDARNVLIESARIARGNIIDLKDLTIDRIDALILPGGYGAVKNLSDFAVKGPQAEIQADVLRILQQMLAAGKPVGAICIAPAVLVRALAMHSPEVTIGADTETAAAIETMGGRHVPCRADQIHVDTRLRIVTTPSYMVAARIKDVAAGIEKLVREVLLLLNQSNENI